MRPPRERYPDTERSQRAFTYARRGVPVTSETRDASRGLFILREWQRTETEASHIHHHSACPVTEEHTTDLHSTHSTFQRERRSRASAQRGMPCSFPTPSLPSACAPLVFLHYYSRDHYRHASLAHYAQNTRYFSIRDVIISFLSSSHFFNRFIRCFS